MSASAVGHPTHAIFTLYACLLLFLSDFISIPVHVFQYLRYKYWIPYHQIPVSKRTSC